MVCPECRAEYRPGFSRCADCDVDLVQELPVELSGTLQRTWSGRTERRIRDSIEGWFRTKPRTKSALTFGLHQLIGVYGIPNTAPLVLGLFFNLLFLLGRGYPRRTFYSIVSERPYFPVQIIFALILGWLLGRALRHRSMLWVWALPLAILCYSLVTARVLIPTSVFANPGVFQSRFSHYFGWGCRPADRCLDQLLITMPFYSSLAYSMGAALARKTLGYASSQSEKHFRAVMFAGLFVLGASIIDLTISTHISGWHNMYLLLAVIPTGLSAFLLYAGSTIRPTARLKR